MKRLLWMVAVSIMLFSCKEKAPKGIIEPERLQKILYDIHIVDGYISSVPGQDSARKVAASYYSGIYKKFNTDSAQYNRSLNYYYAHPKELSEIYSNIAKELNAQKRAMEKIDSVKQAKLKKAVPLAK